MNITKGTAPPLSPPSLLSFVGQLSCIGVSRQGRVAQRVSHSGTSWFQRPRSAFTVDSVNHCEQTVFFNWKIWAVERRKPRRFRRGFHGGHDWD